MAFGGFKSLSELTLTYQLVSLRLRRDRFERFLG